MVQSPRLLIATLLNLAMAMSSAHAGDNTNPQAYDALRREAYYSSTVRRAAGLVFIGDAESLRLLAGDVARYERDRAGTLQDFRIAELAMQSGCATILVLNKWDLTSGDEFDIDHTRARVAQKLRLRPQVFTTSAKSGRNVQRVLQETVALADRSRQRIPTPELNRFLAEVAEVRQPPAKQGKRLKMLYAAQIEVGPPRVAIQINHRQRLTRDYAYFIENQMRARYSLEGVPLIIDFKPRTRR